MIDELIIFLIYFPIDQWRFSTIFHGNLGPFWTRFLDPCVESLQGPGAPVAEAGHGGDDPRTVWKPMDGHGVIQNWLVVWNMTCIFPLYWEFHHPN